MAQFLTCNECEHLLQNYWYPVNHQILIIMPLVFKQELQQLYGEKTTLDWLYLYSLASMPATVMLTF